MVSYPGFPPPPPSGWGQPADPGPIPLRPLTAGDLLGAGLGVVRRHLGLLGPLSVLVAALSSAASLGVLAATGTLTEFADGTWADAMLSGRQVTLPIGIYLATGASLAITVIGAIMVSAVATACAGVDAMGRQSVRGALAERLAGRIGPLLATSAVVGVAVSVGLVLVVAPGVLIYAAWAAAAPAAAMERGGPAAALQRSVRLTRGRRGRVVGMTLLVLVVAFAINVLVSSVVQGAAGGLSPVGSLVVSDAVSAIVAAVTTSWVGAVIALLYIDIRVRTENLGPALRAFAAADRTGRAGGPAFGQA